MINEKKTYYTQSLEEIYQEFHTSNEGLTNEQAEKNLDQYGRNKLAESKKKSLVSKFLDQFKDLMIIVLLVASLISAFSGEVTDSLIILSVVILNAIFGVVQEAKAEEAIDALKEMSTPSARVKRNGQVVTVKSDELVPGDVVLLEAGDVVPADVRFIEAASLKIEESALTGESVPVEKEVTTLTDDDTSLGDRVNMGYMNSNVTYGRGIGVVVATGMNTEVGHIAGMLASADETETPLKASLNQLGKVLTVIILLIAVIMFVVGVFFNGRPVIDMLMTSISLAVAAIPEGLPAIVTIILALGTQKMARRKALVRKLPAVETLGATDIICSDKTGTLTMNQMTVEQFMSNNQVQSANEPVSPDNKTLQIMTFCNDTKANDQGELLGDPTETALIAFGDKQDYPLTQKLQDEPRIAEIPFDSERKLMTTVHQMTDGRYFIAVKGAPDELLKACDKYDVNGTIETMDEREMDFILKVNKEWATQALRVLAMAYKIVDNLPEMNPEQVEKELIFSGLIGMIDPERKEAADAVKVAKEAGIRPIMITGDHRDTAEAIAARLGIIKEGQDDAVITGAELDDMDEKTFEEKVRQYSVYARVSPEHKVRIVKAWQDQGKIVAMTGDGVNDAPALKTADIGIGMGITGTEVSKGASDMVLADDNFSTIVVAVEEGRKVFSNIQKTIQYLLSANLGEVIALFVATMCGWDTLLPVHLLWINLVTDTFPAIALGVDPAEKDVMKHKPRGKKSNFFSGGVMSSIIYQGILEGLLTLFVYFYAVYISPVHTTTTQIHEDALTMTFATLGLLQLFHAFNVKSIHGSIFTVGVFRNKAFNFAILMSFVLLAITIVVPGLNDLFDVAHLDWHQWLVVLLTSISIIPIVEIVKFVQRRTLKNI